MKKTIFIAVILFILCSTVFAKMESLWVSGYKYYPLYAVCKEKNIDYEWDAVGRMAILRKNGVEARIRMGSDMMLVDGGDLKDIGPPSYFYNGMVLIPSSFARREMERIFKRKASAKAKTKQKKKGFSFHGIKTIVLDPGHGGKDPGAVGRYYSLKEKDVNLDMARRLKTLLSYHGIKVYITRDKDIFIPLEERAEFTNKKGADLFISLHANASRAKWLKGFEIYYLSEKRMDDSERALKAAKDKASKFDEGTIDKRSATAKAIAYDLKFTENRIESKELAKSLIKSVKRKGIYSRKNSLKDARFHVLKNFKTDMPAILVEIGYLSNRGEERLLRLSSYRQKIAQGLADGILEYKRKYERLNGFTR